MTDSCSSWRPWRLGSSILFDRARDRGEPRAIYELAYLRRRLRLPRKYPRVDRGGSALRGLESRAHRGHVLLANERGVHQIGEPLRPAPGIGRVEQLQELRWIQLLRVDDQVRMARREQG